VKLTSDDDEDDEDEDDEIGPEDLEEPPAKRARKN
jgi:hypothetical protein